MPAAFVRAPAEGKQDGAAGGELLEKLLFTEIETSRRSTHARVTKAQLGISPWQQERWEGRGLGSTGGCGAGLGVLPAPALL